MTVRKSFARWDGDLKGGRGLMALDSCDQPFTFSFSSRFEEGDGTNPEELIAAAHAGCYSMALSHALSEAGYEARQVKTESEVHLEKHATGYIIPKVVLLTEADVVDIDEATFSRIAHQTRQECPISKVLSAIDVELQVRLVVNA
jgi:osmotically inducible protein OsmC